MKFVSSPIILVIKNNIKKAAIERNNIKISSGIMAFHLLEIVFILLCILFFLSACTNQVGGEAIFNHINELEKGLDQPNWTELSIQANELKKMYEEDKWKLQLIGDEGEYEDLYKSIGNLIATVKEKDPLSTRMEIATTRTLLEEIYSL